MLGTSITFAQVSVTFPTISGAVGSSKTADILVGDLTGQNVTSYQFSMNYDNSKVEVTGVTVAGTKSEVGQISYNADVTNGVLTVAWANSQALTGSGILLKININFKAAGTTALTPSSFLFNNGVPAANLTAGQATAASVQVYVEDVTTSGLNSEFLIPIKTTQIVAGDNILSFNFNGTFDPAKLEITGWSYEQDALGIGGQVSINTDNTAGTVSLAWAKGTAISGTGTLVYLKAKAKVKGSSTVNITSFMYNTGSPAVVTAAGTVTLTNKKPAFAAATDTKTVNENAALAFTVVATDGDSDALTYSATGLPTGATFNTSTGAFAWTPSYTQAGVYTVVFKANDGTVDSDPLTVTITVNDVNRTPTISLNPAGPFTVAEGQLLTFTVVASDPDTDNTITVSASGVPSGATFNTSTKVFSWTPLFNQAGSYNVLFTVKDNKNAMATVPASITVTNTNTPPSFAVAGAKQMPDTTILGGKNLIFTYKAIDAEGDNISYFLQDPKPEGAIIVSSTGVFGWKPSNKQAGKWQIVVLASDGVFSTPSRIAYVTVIPDTKVETEEIPASFELYQNYPNPFNPTTSIKFGLPKESHVRLSVYTILGQEVATLVNNVMSAGYHTVNFDASNLPSGMYIYKIDAGDFSQIKKMLLMK
ncbi:putative Ig domain-containing protein [Stygiobacter electus]|uniref:Ig domain-containing protein n=1 Tax=Stygiobacter electus TaxID=3032292 RepID=A0AAE3P2C2_9BACT|nr:putative Ig domain-containing protein [Stygiobacter electus]MDF1611783.1 putative Ig domain-containing protein [Stygiobacter electus]